MHFYHFPSFNCEKSAGENFLISLFGRSLDNILKKILWNILNIIFCTLQQYMYQKIRVEIVNFRVFLSYSNK